MLILDRLLEFIFSLDAFSKKGVVTIYLKEEISIKNKDSHQEYEKTTPGMSGISMQN